jgi:hypothetical protein
MLLRHPVGSPPTGLLEQTMAEFLRSAAIVLMGLTVIGAGVVVVFFG